MELVECLHVGIQEAYARSPVSIDGEAGLLPSGNAELSVPGQGPIMPLAFFLYQEAPHEPERQYQVVAG